MSLKLSVAAAALLASLAGCDGVVQSGYPPLVAGCHESSDCRFAGPGFVCADGGCTEATCHCDGDCPHGVGCYLAVTTVGECAGTAPLAPCPIIGGGDGGAADGGGGLDGGSADAGSADAG